MLTDSYIRSLKIGDKKRHTDLYGLVLELRPTKKRLNKVFIFRFQWDKKPQTMTLGCYPGLSLAKAREQVLIYRQQIEDEVDPRIGESDQRKKLAFREVAEMWYQKHSHRWKAVTSNRHYKSLIRDVYPFIGDNLLTG